MKELWTKRIRGMILVILIFYSLLCVIENMPFNTPLTSKEFPLEEKWTTTLKSDIEQITIVDNSVVIARTLTNVYALDLQSGEVIWMQRIRRHNSYQPIKAMNGMIFLTDGNGPMAIDLSNGEILWQGIAGNPLSADVVDVSQDFVAVNDPPYLDVFQAEDGTLLWENEVCRGPIQAYFFDNNIIVPCFGLTTFDARSGEILWEMKVKDSIDQVRKSTFSDGVIYYSQDNMNIVAYDVKNRKKIWETQIADGYVSIESYTMLGNYLLVIIDDQLCVFNRTDGSKVWCTQNLVKARNPTIYSDVLYLFNGLQKGITSFSMVDGSPIGRLDFPRYIFISSEDGMQQMVTSDSYIIFASGKRIFAYGK